MFVGAQVCTPLVRGPGGQARVLRIAKAPGPAK